MNRSKKFVCIHGHFYQPPRENAWLETIEIQDSAAPFHDWNERINFECYAPNSTARVLDHEGYIIDIVNNYKQISFNFGPTLLSWMEKADPTTYAAILKADQESLALYDGHGSAIAQVYGHLIMPLANRRDKETQIKWGIRDFEYRFNRKPEGIWLAETAVDTETLEILVDNDIKFTLLAPRQAKAFRRLGQLDWINLPYENIDSRRPYLYQLPSGRSIYLFFYHGEIAQNVAFKGLLNNGKYFAQQFLDAFDHNDTAQLAHIATDGESYGHHHRFGEMALADAIRHIRDNDLAVITNYGQYLEKVPTEYEVAIHENSSWSCVHGIERWRNNCGCNSGGRPGWTQAWRSPLRNTLNWLRDLLIPIYEEHSTPLVNDPWETRNNYIEVVLNRSTPAIQEFVDTNAKYALDAVEKTKLLRLLEMQRQSMQMFTSCGWFFDEISGIETNQILQYAHRAMYYAKQISGVDLHGQFLEKLKEAPSNVFLNGADNYEKNVLPSSVDLTRVGMHFAASSLFEEQPEELELFNYQAESEVFERVTAGTQRLALGRTTIRSKITRSEKQFSFAVLYLGQQHIIGNISIAMDSQHFANMSEQMLASFKNAELGEVIGLMQANFESKKFTIWQLFNEEKRKIIQQVTQENLKKVEKDFREIYNDNYQLMSSMIKSEMLVPEAYNTAVKYVINLDLKRFFSQEKLKIRELKRLLEELEKWKITITDKDSFDLAVSERIYEELKAIKIGQNGLKKINRICEVLETLLEKGLEVDLWKSQNHYFSMAQSLGKENASPSLEWLNGFTKLGNLLKVRS